jgi:hypothetical protein
MGRRRGVGWGLADWAGRGTKPGRQEGNEVFHVFRNVRRVAPPLRKGLDPVRAGGGVIDRAEHEMKSPEHFVARELGQAFAKRIDKLAARGVEILGDKLVEQFGIFRGQNCA